MKYMLVALIFTQSTLDHGAPARQDLGTFDTLDKCEANIDVVKGIFFEGSQLMSPNSAPETIVQVRYVCVPES